MATISKIKLPDGITYNVQDNTSGYIKTETDPTVPSWAKASSKPSYSASEISGLGTAATKNVPSSGNASSTQVVLGSDTRLTNSRPSSDVVQTYSSTSTVPISGKGVAAALATLPEPMVFKGSLGTGGTITSLPTNGTASVGDTYKVITAGTYASKAAKVGDTFICLTKTSSTNTWELIPSGDEPSGTVTSVSISATSPIAVDSTNPITTSGTRTISHANSGVTAGTYQSVTVNATGHVTSGSALTKAQVTTALGYTPPTADTKNTAGSTDTSSKIFLVGATSQAANPQTYSQDTAYVGTDGCLYSGGTKVLTSHQDISGKADKSATVSTVVYDTTNKKFAKTINGTTSDIAKLATTSVGSASNWSAGTTPTLGTAISADDITAWTTNTPTRCTIANGVLTFTAGASASLSYTSRSIPNVTSVGTAPSLTISSTTVATGFTTT